MGHSVPADHLPLRRTNPYIASSWPPIVSPTATPTVEAGVTATVTTTILNDVRYLQINGNYVYQFGMEGDETTANESASIGQS